MTIPSARSIFVVATLAWSLGAGPAVLFAQDSTNPAPSTPQEQPPRDPSTYRTPQLAIDGYDPVAYFPGHGGKPTKGKPEFTHTHRGVTYRFASAANRDAFKADPVRFEPAYGGWCAYAMAKGERVEIDPKAFHITGGRLLLFYKDFFTDTRDPWAKDEPAMTQSADKQWKKYSGEEPPAR